MATDNEYYIGLDGGTNSVGWAVVNPDYSVVKKRGKSLWGVRLFESGKTAAERRGYRSARRRTDRKKWRLKLLREIFDEEVTQIDSSFFARLSESRYWEDDKKVDGKDSLFHDGDFTDKHYHEKFPTIYHLREYLMHCNKKPDIRLVYLATAHIIKNRGHFLYEGKTMEGARSFSTVWTNFCNTAEDILCIKMPQDIENAVELVLLNSELNTTSKKKEIAEQFGKGDGDEEAICLEELANLIAGAKVSYSKLFNDESLEDLGKLSFKEKSIEDLGDVAECLGEERFSLIAEAYGVYSWAIFAKILPEDKTISQVKIELYEKHGYELKLLKELVKQYAKDKYFKVFRSPDEKANYASYIGQTNYGKGKKTLGHCTQKEFNTFLKSELKTLWEKRDSDVRIADLYQDVQNDNLLNRQRSKDNSLIPYQANLEELSLILKNMERFYPFLLEADTDGYTAEHKIKKLLTFRIPYYVGPLNDAHKIDDGYKGFCWIVKKCAKPVLPWNFEEVVDEAKSEDIFINRMTSTCTYLVGEDVLPANSEIYCRFMVLNELNNLRIRGEKISVELKQKIFNELFNNPQKPQSVTVKRLIDFLKANGEDNITKDDISGIDGNFKSSMAPILKLKSIFKENPLDSDTLETLIFSLTVSGDSKKMLKKRVKDVLGDAADEIILRKICAKKLTGWGRLSKIFLTGIKHVDKETGEYHSIMDLLWKDESNPNLMQLLGAEYDFQKAVEKFNEEQNGADQRFDYEHQVQNLYVSTAIKRSIWQTMLIVKEIRKIMGREPARIFVEMARGASPDQKNKRTVSRKAKLLELYKTCKDDSRDWVKEIEDLPEDRFRSDKLYLYYTQMGRCMYSGEKIDLSTLMHEGEKKDRLYDIDHIYPQSKVKDDSLDNRVLVKRKLNAEKGDKYPIKQEMRQGSMWYRLLKNDFISRRKYERLTRNTPFREDELAGFINRQLVETRQSTKAVANLLKRLFPNTEIVYVKAGMVADFRQEFDFVKCRDVNDFHHAKDAYLNVVVGNVYHERFTNNPLNFIRSGVKYSLKTKTLFGDLDTKKGGRIIWEKGKEGSIKTVQYRMEKNDPFVTRQAREVHGELYDLQPMKQGKGQLSLKKGLPIERYGGYNKIVGSYFILVAYTVKKKRKNAVATRQKSIEFIPLYKAEELKKNPSELCKYLAQQLGVDEVEILIPKIKFGTLFKWDGFTMTISGRTGNRLIFCSATEFRSTPSQEEYIKKISNYLERCKKAGNKALDIVPEYDKLTEEDNMMLYDDFLTLLKDSLYSKRFSKQYDFLNKNRNTFKQLPCEYQVNLLAEILHFFQCNPLAANLSALKGPGKAGIIVNSSKIGEEPVYIINQSVTGFFTNEIRLNDL